MINKLLLEVSAINKKYTLINQKTGGYFNIFEIAGISSKEVVICKLLYELLNPNGSHYQGDSYLRLFIKNVLQIEGFTEQDYKSARVSRELVIGGNRRIDLFIETANYKIPIEVKIHAKDQDGQCFDYYKYAQKANLYYLTLDGGCPSEESVGALTPKFENKKIVGYQGVRLISFREDIVDWLDRCLSLPETIKIAPIREIMLQFKDMLNKLAGQTKGGAQMEIINTIISSADNMKCALDIAGSLPEAKAQVMLNLFSELKRLFESSDRKTYDYDEAVFNEYYLSRNHAEPCLSIEIKKFPHDLIAILYISVDWHLYYGFAFAEVAQNAESCEYVAIEQLKTKYPEIYHSFADIVFDVIESDEDRETDVSLFWDFLCDEMNNKFDFYVFSPSCSNLASNCTVQSKKIFEELNSYIDKLLERFDANK